MRELGLSTAAVFPAYAGMSPLAWLVGRETFRFPRLRGDEPAWTPDSCLSTTFSPPTRG